MRVADRLTQREASWRELERLVDQIFERHIRHCQPADVLRLGQLYRLVSTGRCPGLSCFGPYGA
jgi:hypothetical protein